MNFLLRYPNDDDPDDLLAVYPTKEAAEAERDRIAALIARGCELAGAGPYSYDRPPEVVEVPDRVDYATVASEGHYWRKALIAAGEWPA